MLALAACVSPPSETDNGGAPPSPSLMPSPPLALPSPSLSPPEETPSPPEDIAGGPEIREIRPIGPIVSWSTMNIDDPDLTDGQRTVMQYFLMDEYAIVDSFSYGNLRRYPELYRNTKIVFGGGVVKSLNNADDYWLVSMEGMEIDYENSYFYIRHIVPDDISSIGNLAVVKADGGIIPGYQTTLFGRYEDVLPYEIDGETYYLPTVSIDFYERSVLGDAPSALLTRDLVSAAAEAVFGDITVNNPTWGEPDSFFGNVQTHYVISLDRQISADYKDFAFLTGMPGISPRNTDFEWKGFYTSVDFQHYMISISNRAENTFRLEYYDRDFNKLWEREFRNRDPFTSPVRFDYTSELIYLTAGTDLHIIDIMTGEDIISPASVGQKLKVRVVENGVVMIGTGRTNNIMKTDFAGNILWKVSIGVESGWGWWSTIQIVDGNLIAVIGEYRDSKTVLISADGEVLFDVASRT
jgi:hypothetical protein